MRVIVIDTETIGKVSQDLLNVGYKIVDINIQQATYTTLCERDYLVCELINNEVYCINDDFVGAIKYDKYMVALKQKKAIKRNIKQIFTTLSNDIKKYGVLFGYAYNCAFDIDKFTRTAEKYGISNPLDQIPVFDIWAYAFEYICSTPEYISWAKENNVFSDTEKYIKTSVEAVCKYLYGNLDFIEDHTALSDVQHETAILIECIKNGCDITRPLPKAKRIASEKVFTKVIKYKDTEIIVEYTSCYERNGVITYK